MTIRIVVAAVLMLATNGLAVQSEESGWMLRMYGALVDSSADNRTDTTGFSATLDAGGGLGIGAEYQWSSRLGLELSTLIASADMKLATSTRNGVSSTQSLGFSMVPVTLGLTFHLNPDGRADIFVAPTVSYVSYSEIESRYDWNDWTMSVGASSDTALGVTFGVDVPFGESKWNACTGLRYMKTSAGEAKIDPLIVTLGFGRRF